jgi:hypothetical protein
VVLKLEEVSSTEACYEFLHEELGAYLLVGVEGLALDIFSLWLCLASWLCDVDDPDALLVNLVISFPLMNGVGRDKAVMMSMRRSPKV